MPIAEPPSLESSDDRTLGGAAHSFLPCHHQGGGHSVELSPICHEMRVLRDSLSAVFRSVEPPFMSLKSREVPRAHPYSTDSDRLGVGACRRCRRGRCRGHFVGVVVLPGCQAVGHCDQPGGKHVPTGRKHGAHPEPDDAAHDRPAGYANSDGHTEATTGPGGDDLRWLEHDDRGGRSRRLRSCGRTSGHVHPPSDPRQPGCHAPARRQCGRDDGCLRRVLGPRQRTYPGRVAGRAGVHILNLHG